MFFLYISRFASLYTFCFFYGLVQSAPTELTETLKAPVVERTVEEDDDAAKEQQVEVEKNNWWRSDGLQRPKHKKKTQPTLRDPHQKHQESLPVFDNERVLTNEEPRDMQEEEEIVDVEYRYNVFPKSRVETNEVRRRADDQVWEPIRIFPYFSLGNLDDQTAEYIKHVVKAGVASLEKLMNVERVVGKLKLSANKNCGPQNTIHSDHSDIGVDADVVIYILAVENAPTCSGVVAYAGSCMRDRKGRPIAGYINYCKLSSEHRRTKWRSDVEIAVHELSHILF